MWTLVIAAIAAGTAFAMERAARRLALFRVDPGQARVVEVPEWVPPEWIAEARAAVASREPFSIFDGDAADRLRRELEALTWVRRAEEIDRALPRTLRLALTPREPVAVVEAAGAFVLVDEGGLVLPPGTFRAESLERLPRVTRWKGEFSSPAVGRPWNDESVQDGIAMALLLPEIAARVPGVKITTIDVTNSGGQVDARETEILLVASSNVKLKWGRAPRTGKFGELPVDAKLANLRLVESRFPGLRGLGVVNLRFDEPDVFDDKGQWVQRPMALAAPPQPAQR